MSTHTHTHIVHTNLFDCHSSVHGCGATGNAVKIAVQEDMYHMYMGLVLFFFLFFFWPEVTFISGMCIVCICSASFRSRVFTGSELKRHHHGHVECHKDFFLDFSVCASVRGRLVTVGKGEIYFFFFVINSPVHDRYHGYRWKMM